LRNDLQAVVCRLYPAVADYIAELGRYGRAMMTGSGACVFAEFESQEKAHTVLRQLPDAMRGVVVKGLMRHPLHDWVPD
jgi:4-diphosphocytidyl-2-C-methyl-D-erythritol kinase